MTAVVRCPIRLDRVLVLFSWFHDCMITVMLLGWDGIREVMSCR
jgi:hypothetical protein